MRALRSLVLASLGLTLLAPAASAAPVVFTGDADADFSSATAIVLTDVTGVDVGVPIQAPPGTISGHDIESLVLDFDGDTDTLYVGFDTFGISGDVDGDGADGVSSAWLLGNGGIDTPDFAGGEVAAILLDIDEDGIYDIAAGINDANSLAGFQVSTYLSVVPPTSMGLSFAWTTPLPHAGAAFYAPSPGAPHFEFAITDFSTLPTSSGTDTAASFGIAAHMGSSADDGIGEDFTPNAVGATLPPTPVCFDLDLDGVTTCDGDCDDMDPLRFPGNAEACDGIDNDCDGVVPSDEIDDDGDGMAECEGDCDDADPTTYAGAPELCDGIDNDCDGVVPGDEIDDDLDGLTECEGDCDDTNANTYPGAPEICDGLDNDCDAVVPSDEIDDDGDGMAECDGDCDDADANNFPGNVEACDGQDNDCDGAVDEGFDADGDGVNLCDGDCDDNDPNNYPGNTEVCDGGDNDCDGAIDEGFDADGDGVAVCDGDCDDNDPTTYPGAPELCDGLDNDCDGVVPADETDDDGDGFAECDGDCDDADSTTYPGADELCDGLDNDCDGTVDEDLGGGTLDLGAASDFNVFVFEDITDIPDVGGAIAACGDIDLDGFAVNHQNPGGTAIVAGNDLFLDNGTVFGSAYYGNSAAVPLTVFFHLGGLINGSPIDCPAAEADLTATSATLAAQAANGATVVQPWFAIELTGTEAGLNIFDLDAADLANAVSLSIDVPSGSTVLVNISGTAVSMTNFGWSLNGVDATGILYNAPDATTVDLLNVGVQGSMLAPHADVDFNNGSFDGQLVANSLTGSGEPHHFPFDGDLTVGGCTDEICDGLDNDGDGDIDEGFDVDGDGYTSCGGDCDDDDPGVNPGAPEICDGIDNDCNGLVDDGLLDDTDGDGIPDCIEACPQLIDFDSDAYGNPIAPGDEVSGAYGAWGVTIQQWSDPNMAILEPIPAYDSSNPLPGDENIGTPNETFGGPGIGAGGEAGEPGENDDDHGNVVAVNDDNTWALVSFTNSTCVHSIDIIDAEPGELEPQVLLFDMNLILIDTVTASALGTNSVETLDLGGVCGVFAIMIDFYADGAWDNLEVCIDPAAEEEICGDGLDNDGDGDIDEDCTTAPPGDDDDSADDEDTEPECGASMTGRSGSWFGLALLVVGLTRRRRAVV